MRISDWGSDVCSSDLHRPLWIQPLPGHAEDGVDEVEIGDVGAVGIAQVAAEVAGVGAGQAAEVVVVVGGVGVKRPGPVRRRCVAELAAEHPAVRSPGAFVDEEGQGISADAAAVGEWGLVRGDAALRLYVEIGRAGGWEMGGDEV